MGLKRDRNHKQTHSLACTIATSRFFDRPNLIRKKVATMENATNNNINVANNNTNETNGANSTNGVNSANGVNSTNGANAANGVNSTNGVNSATATTAATTATAATAATATNGTMLQAFSWYMPADGRHWRRLARMAPTLAKMGITAVWLPPASKTADGDHGVGYGVYDLWDLGEFKQCGSVRTKYGTKKEYLACVAALKAAGIQAMGDIVLNQRFGGEETEHVRAVEVDGSDRTRPVGEEQTIAAWTRFRFPGRKGAYSDFTWDWTCFHGTDWDEDARRSAVYLFAGKHWDDDVDHVDNGNYDYLMGSDVDVSDPRVAEELTRWGEWYISETGVDGLRLDALKHISKQFYRTWLAEMRRRSGRELFTVGEYWSPRLQDLVDYLGSDKPMSLFDVPLHYKFFFASNSMGQQDLSKLFDDTLVATDPIHAVTFVDNHDTQPGQALQSTVEAWFKPSAYMAILLREAGYPCVFYGDLFGMPTEDEQAAPVPAVAELPLLMEVRQRLSYGPQHDYLDDPGLIGWTREGDDTHERSGLAVVLTDGTGGEKRMYVGTQHAGERWSALVGAKVDVIIDGEGYGDFPTPAGTGSLYVDSAALPLLSHKRRVKAVTDFPGFELPQVDEGAEPTPASSIAAARGLRWHRSGKE